MTAKKKRCVEKADWRGRKLRYTVAFVLGFVFGGAVRPERKNLNKPADITNFTEVDLQIVIDEGRRQLDAQVANLIEVRGRAQTLLTVSLALLAFVAGSFARLHNNIYSDFNYVDIVVWIFAFVIVLVGFTLAAAVIVVQADFCAIDTTQLTGYPLPLLRSLAEDYAKSVRLGEITVATRITIFRKATRYTYWGAVLTSVVYMITR